MKPHVNRVAPLALCLALVAPAGARDFVDGEPADHPTRLDPAVVAARDLSAQASDIFALPRQRIALTAASDRLMRELSGEAEPDEPRDAAVRLGGFVEALGAYTYANPSHWSRAVTRLQLVAQGEINPDVKWKLGGRVDFDPVYLNSGFYPDAVKNNQRLNFFYRENYLDFSAGDWDFRLGAQQIIWGEVIGLFFADVVSARDMREFLLPSFDVIRIPQWAARAEYTLSEAHLEFIWIPVPVFDEIGKPGSEFYPVPLPSPLPPGVESSFHDPQHPDRTLGNSNAGIRGNFVYKGWDVSSFVYRAFSTSPTFYLVKQGNTAFFEPRYDRLWQVGGTLTKDFQEFVFRAEGVYTHGQKFSALDVQTADSGVVGRQTLDLIATAEWALPHDSRVNVQAFGRHLFGGSSGINPISAHDGFGMSIFASTKLTATVEPEVLWIQYIEHRNALIRPRINWQATANLVSSIGVDIFTGQTQSFFGRYNNRDRVYAQVRLSF